jgi:uncharacterized membrane protein YqjE
LAAAVAAAVELAAVELEEVIENLIRFLFQARILQVHWL